MSPVSAWLERNWGVVLVVCVAILLALLVWVGLLPIPGWRPRPTATPEPTPPSESVPEPATPEAPTPSASPTAQPEPMATPEPTPTQLSAPTGMGEFLAFGPVGCEDVDPGRGCVFVIDVWIEGTQVVPPEGEVKLLMIAASPREPRDVAPCQGATIDPGVFSGEGTFRVRVRGAPCAWGPGLSFCVCGPGAFVRIEERYNVQGLATPTAPPRPAIVTPTR